MVSPPDLDALVRRIRPDRIVSAVPLRPRPSAPDATSPRRSRLMLDTNIYILDLGGNLSPAIVALLDASTLHHCSVCLGEIAVGLAARDVGAPGWRSEIRVWSRLFRSMPATRIHTPDRDVWIEAGLLSGSLARVQGYAAQDRRKALNDALVYLTARKAGLPLLTENRKDFDRLQQLAPGCVVHYVP